MELSHSELDNNLLEIENLFKNSNGETCSISARGPIGDIGLTGMDGAIISEEAPINPDLNPVSTTWVQVDYVNNVVVGIFKFVNGKWNINEIKIISGGTNFTYLQKADGTVWRTGSGWYGAVETPSPLTTFTQLDASFNNCRKISCGDGFVFIEKADGTIWVTGENTNGQLGLGHNTNIFTFTQLNVAFNNPKLIRTFGYGYTYIVKNDGTTWFSGNRYDGQAVNTFIQLTEFTNPKDIIVGSLVVIIKTTGDVFIEDTNKITFKSFGISNPKKIVSDKDYSSLLILDSSNKLLVYGSNARGQLGAGSIQSFNVITPHPYITETVDNIYGGHSVTFIKFNKTLFSTGWYFHNGHNSLITQYTQLPIYFKEVIGTLGYFTFALDYSGQLYGGGLNNQYQLGTQNVPQTTVFFKMTL